jgi:hypothetical protein
MSTTEFDAMRSLLATYESRFNAERERMKETLRLVCEYRDQLETENARLRDELEAARAVAV